MTLERRPGDYPLRLIPYSTSNDPCQFADRLTPGCQPITLTHDDSEPLLGQLAARIDGDLTDCENVPKIALCELKEAVKRLAVQTQQLAWKSLFPCLVEWQRQGVDRVGLWLEHPRPGMINPFRDAPDHEPVATEPASEKPATVHGGAAVVAQIKAQHGLDDDLELVYLTVEDPASCQGISAEHQFQRYAVTALPAAYCGLVVWGERNGRWYPNPYNCRPLIKQLIGQLVSSPAERETSLQLGWRQIVAQMDGQEPVDVFARQLVTCLGQTLEYLGIQPTLPRLLKSMGEVSALYEKIRDRAPTQLVMAMAEIDQMEREHRASLVRRTRAMVKHLEQALQRQD